MIQQRPEISTIRHKDEIGHVLDFDKFEEWIRSRPPWFHAQASDQNNCPGAKYLSSLGLTNIEVGRLHVRFTSRGGLIFVQTGIPQRFSLFISYFDENSGSVGKGEIIRCIEKVRAELG